MRKAAHANIRISQDPDTALAKTAKKINIPKAALVKEALLAYMEGVDDIQVLHDRKNEPIATLDEARKRIGLFKVTVKRSAELEACSPRSQHSKNYCKFFAGITRCGESAFGW